MVNKRNILVYTNGEVIGDGILKLPFISALKKADPNIHLTWLCSGDTVYNSLLKDIVADLIDEIIVLNPNKNITLSGALFSKLPLKGKSFDVIIDTQNVLKHTLWLRRFSYQEFISASVKGLLSTIPVGKDILNEKSILNRLMLLGALALGVDELEIEEIKLHDNKYIEEAKALLPDDKKYIGYVVGSGHEEKIWPLENFLSLAKLNVEKGFTPVFILGPKEKDILPEIKEKFPDAIIPDLESVYLKIALAQRLDAAVANDSGGGHIIAAGNVPMVSIACSKYVRQKFRPISSKVISVSPDLLGFDEVKYIQVKPINTMLEKLLV